MRNRRLATAALALLFAVAFSVAPVAAQPGLQVTAPGDGALVEDTNVTVEFDVSNFTFVSSAVPLTEAGQHPEVNREGEGHLHFMLDLGAVIVWDRTEPYTFTDVPPGEHVLVAELVNNDHSSLSPAVVQQVRFRSSAPQMLPNTGASGPGDASGLPILLSLAGVALIVAGFALARARRSAS
jgi:hypothetical protein